MTVPHILTGILPFFSKREKASLISAEIPVIICNRAEFCLHFREISSEFGGAMV